MPLGYRVVMPLYYKMCDGRKYHELDVLEF